jgi:hypothetical protein
VRCCRSVFSVSVAGVTLDVVEVLPSDLARIPGIPVGNLHVPRDQFVAVWRAAECRVDGVTDWYALGVVETCRWLGGAIVRRKSGRWEPAYAPVTGTTSLAYEELVDQECVRAEGLAMRVPVAGWLQRRPGWLPGVLATLNWAWRRTAAAPLDAGGSVTG